MRTSLRVPAPFWQILMHDYCFLKYFYGKDFSIIVDEAANDRIDSRLREDFIARGDTAPAPLQSMRSRGNTGQNGRPACLYFSCVEISCCHFELFEIPERTVC